LACHQLLLNIIPNSIANGLENALSGLQSYIIKSNVIALPIAIHFLKERESIQKNILFYEEESSENSPFNS
jgi:hypothetical protein